MKPSTATAAMMAALALGAASGATEQTVRISHRVANYERLGAIGSPGKPAHWPIRYRSSGRSRKSTRLRSASRAIRRAAKRGNR